MFTSKYTIELAIFMYSFINQTSVACCVRLYYCSCTSVVKLWKSRGYQHTSELIRSIFKTFFFLFESFFIGAVRNTKETLYTNRIMSRNDRNLTALDCESKNKTVVIEEIDGLQSAFGHYEAKFACLALLNMNMVLFCFSPREN